MTYTIRKGHHYSNFLPKLFLRDFKEEFTVALDDSCRYSIKEKSCVNKLYGYCFGITGVHKNSFRIGWTFNKEKKKFDLYSYIYDNGTLTKRVIYTVNPDEVFKVSITCMKVNCSDRRIIAYYINDTFIEVFELFPKALTCWSLGPYFGGNTPAPHEMYIPTYQWKRERL